MLPLSNLITHPLVVGLIFAAAGVTLVVYSNSYAIDSDDNIDDQLQPIPYLPGNHPILGHTFLLARNLDRFQDWLVETSIARDGKPFVLRQPGKNDWWFSARPKDFEQILKVHFDTFIKGSQVRELLDDFMGENIVIINGSRWKFQRKALVHLFTAKALREEMTPIVQKCALALQRVYAKAAKERSIVDVHRMMGRFTLEIFAEIEFGTQLGLLDSEIEHPFETAIDAANHISLERFAVPMWVWKIKRWLQIGSERELTHHMTIISTFVMDCISKAMARRNKRQQVAACGEPLEPVAKDIVSILLDSQDWTNEPVKPQDVFNISLAGVLAGKDTTGDATSWLMHLLHENPRVEQKLRHELLTKLPRFIEEESYVPSLDELDAISYLKATIRESLRLKPPAPCVTQHCTRDTVFPDGTFIPKGMDTTLLYHASALLPSVWGPDAHEFKPERFLDENDKLLVMPPLKFIAFSAGPRKCVGQQLALIEMKVVTACLLSRFHLTQVPGQDIRGTMGISLGMKNGMKVTVDAASFA
ncbi:cytochrome P450, putative [Plasmopara halstedii]|uniref:Cytochrome P450, putative n=1 Tax=Plasmopara halstedii TaxID=4781 RepID=A0A0P1B709_PLAHL|nr:cytochrome P450, putative [Plasmopara halstedii]CEG49610.1 cytochrome P450, putative [Plasmopara halstedii]|eukprot:XP_024585979.1 cytochrome P450, putative [Plasmopara halstedii]